MAAVVLSVLGYGALTTGARGPGFGQVLPPVVSTPSVAASLSYSGEDVIITGSVEHVFEAGGFVGPSRTLKQDRARINVDALSFTKAFEQSRTRLAALRNPPAASRLADAVAKPAAAAAPEIAVASIDPASGTSALSAINEFAPDQSLPMPAVASEQLAYARASEPATEMTKPTSKYSEKELWCLATAIYFEARGEAYRGQVAVAQVVLNRTKHKLYPNSICGVVFQNQQKRNACQFSFACDGQPETVTDRKSWTQAEEIAKKVSSGELYLAEVSNATHYHANYVYPDWAPRMKKIVKIGLHVFYRFKHGWTFG
jgi:spore germination cell wall hydrolase CwlJ-like protein